MRTLLLLGLASWTLSAQPISIGVKAGIPITDALDTVQGNNGVNSIYTANNHRYVIGGTIQFNLPARFSIEVDGLYRRLGYNHQTLLAPTPSHTQTVANSWEFPVMGKFAILPGPIRPFVAAGANFRQVNGVEQTGTTTTVAEFTNDFTTGLTFGGGVEFKLGFVRITPELRYTHWGTENFHDPINSFLNTNKNQGDFMLGITF